MQRTSARRFAPLVALATALLFASGCGKGSGSLSGTVVYMGYPLKSGTIELKDADGKFHTTQIDTEGRYSISGLPNGEVKIGVSTGLTVEADPDAPPIPAVGGKGGPRDRGASKPAEPAIPDPNVRAIPAIAGDIEKSGLSATVAGKTVFEIKIN